MSRSKPFNRVGLLSGHPRGSRVQREESVFLALDPSEEGKCTVSPAERISQQCSHVVLPECEQTVWFQATHVSCLNNDSGAELACIKLLFCGQV